MHYTGEQGGPQLRSWRRLNSDVGAAFRRVTHVLSFLREDLYEHGMG